MMKLPGLENAKTAEALGSENAILKQKLAETQGGLSNGRVRKRHAQVIRPPRCFVSDVASCAWLTKQLEADNPDAALRASRAEFGNLVAQIHGILDDRGRPEAAVDDLFAGLAGDDGKVDLADFLHRPSTIEWFLSSATRLAVEASDAADDAGMRERAAPRGRSDVQEVD